MNRENKDYLQILKALSNGFHNLYWNLYMGNVDNNVIFR